MECYPACAVNTAPPRESPMKIKTNAKAGYMVPGDKGKILSDCAKE